MAKADLTAERLRELLNYDPETGVFTWRVRRSQMCKPVMLAGDFNTDKYWRIGIDGAQRPAHRLAWLYMTGEWPSHTIDHINGVRHDNRWCNLRDIPFQENMLNQHTQRKSKSGLRGAYPFGSRWYSLISVKGEKIQLGTFDTPEEAHAAYISAKAKYHKIEAHTSSS